MRKSTITTKDILCVCQQKKDKKKKIILTAQTTVQEYKQSCWTVRRRNKTAKTRRLLAFSSDRLCDDLHRLIYLLLRFLHNRCVCRKMWRLTVPWVTYFSRCYIIYNGDVFMGKKKKKSCEKMLSSGRQYVKLLAALTMGDAVSCEHICKHTWWWIQWTDNYIYPLL